MTRFALRPCKMLFARRRSDQLLHPLALCGDIGNPSTAEAGLLFLGHLKPVQCFAIITGCLSEDAKRIVANYNHLVLGVDIRFARCLIERSQKFLSRSIQVAAYAEDHSPAEVKTRHRAVTFRAEPALEEVPGECAQIFLKSLFNRSAALSSLPFRQKRLQTGIR